MKIISKHKDYYDSVRGMLFDDSIIYKRYKQVVEIDELNSLPLVKGYKRIGKKEIIDYMYFIIGFCGKFYLGLRFGDKITYEIKKQTSFVRDKQEVTISYRNTWIDVSYYNWFIDENDISTFKKHLESIFLKYNCPTFAVIASRNGSKSNVIINPILKEYKFYKVIPSYQVFQEISMYLGNDLVKEKSVKIPVGTDKDLAESKGFNKYSFRKDKEK